MNYRLLSLFGLWILPMIADAHSNMNHVTGFMSGFIHPLSGLDHIVAMVAVGILAQQKSNYQRYLLPSIFIILMTFSALLAMNQLIIPYSEIAIIISDVILITLIVIGYHFAAITNAMLVGFFAIFHGFSHGIEMPLNENSLEYISGFIVATAGLHILGLLTPLYVIKNAIRYFKFS
ncbi:MAG: hypothetical protein RL637_1843 [Pseudomonadota bacterium]|jgi:urease accessory protein